jgi:hypothetical protein
MGAIVLSMVILALAGCVSGAIYRETLPERQGGCEINC